MILSGCIARIAIIFSKHCAKTFALSLKYSVRFHATRNKVLGRGSPTEAIKTSCQMHPTIPEQFRTTDGGAFGFVRGTADRGICGRISKQPSPAS